MSNFFTHLNSVLTAESLYTITKMCAMWKGRISGKEVKFLPDQLDHSLVRTVSHENQSKNLSNMQNTNTSFSKMVMDKITNIRMIINCKYQRTGITRYSDTS
jgi:hypothetical protein